VCEAGLPADHTSAIFAAELILLLFFGRVLGELMSRAGQPAIFGQLLAGVLLGPSLFGVLLPEVRRVVFPDDATLKGMIDAISQIGILLLLLLTGMETNVALINRNHRVVILSSLFGIATPFVFGVLLAYALPGELLSQSSTQLITALFLGTALSISSVKIVAMVLMEVGAIRRDLGQLILATAILDDTIAWIIIAVIAGMAARGAVSMTNIGVSLAGTIIFLAFSFTLGRRLVARTIRWTNDNMTIDVPVITAIVLVMLLMALATDLIGVHTALGAFVAGMLVGQSPILTEHIEGELRGFIVAFFSPVFFAVAGLGMNLRVLLEPTMLLVTIAIIVVASVGKSCGALIGGRLGGLTGAESLALATGLNARGSTEVIVASIGLSMGALSNQLYTMIVVMAVITTMAMPPTLRWVIARVPLREAEAKRLEREEAAERESVPKMERALVYLDAGPNAALAASLAGLFVAREQILTTVMERSDVASDSGYQRLTGVVAHVLENMPAPSDADPPRPTPLSLQELVQAKAADSEEAFVREASKGYSIAFIGIDGPMSTAATHFAGHLAAFDGPLAIALHGAPAAPKLGAPLNILVPTGGTEEARLATEIALALAKASAGSLTALHVFAPQYDTDLLRGRARRQGLSLLADARRLGKRSGVPVSGITVTHSRPEIEIRRATRAGRYDLVVIGTSFRQGATKFLGPRSSDLIRSLQTPLLLVAR
jgi:Kef-type K+ transport system membrane component KefB/nucleotide-binding universal stress UspA family protein